MKERPIIFSGPMVQAILAGDKTQTRRVIKPQPDAKYNIPQQCMQKYLWNLCVSDNLVDGWLPLKESPYGRAGDQLWVRETYRQWGNWVKNGKPKTGKQAWTFKRKGNIAKFTDDLAISRTKLGWHKRPSIFMPKWATRIWLEVTEIRVERVQDTTEEDIKAEGFNLQVLCPHRWFYELWNSINEKRGYSWGSNPWVWVVSFTRRSNTP